MNLTNKQKKSLKIFLGKLTYEDVETILGNDLTNDQKLEINFDIDDIFEKLTAE